MSRPGNTCHAAFLLWVFLAPFSGTYFYLQYESWRIQRQVEIRVEAGIPVDSLVSLCFLTRDLNHLLHWEHSREFVYQEQMYDVVSQSMRGDSTLFRCWWDREETAVRHAAHDFLAMAYRTQAPGKTSPGFFPDYYKNLFSPTAIGLRVLPSEFAISKGPISGHKAWESVSFRPPWPPPEVNF